MPNNIIGLEYQLPYTKIETEEQLKEIFSELKEIYTKFNSNFSINTAQGNPIENFNQFLNIAVQNKKSIILTGSGDIGGFVVKNASISYNLSQIGEITKYWDQYIDGSCHECKNHYYQQDGGDMNHACVLKTKLDWSKNCLQYDSKLKNSEGKTARKLNELLEEVINKV